MVGILAHPYFFCHSPQIICQTGSIKQRLLAVYVRDGLATKGGCDEYKLASFKSLLGSLTREDFSGVVQPVLEKLQKKNPDSVLLAVASLVKYLRIDLSANVGVFLPPLLRQLRSAKEDVRRIAVELMGYLAERCNDAEVGAYASCWNAECVALLFTSKNVVSRGPVGHIPT